MKVISKPDANDKIINKLFSINKKKRKEGIVEHLIDNLLKSEVDYESPRRKFIIT